MKIRDVRSMVRRGRLAEVQYKHGVPVRGFQDLLFVRVTTECGHVGYGEASSWPVFTGLTASASKELVDGLIAPAIIGMPVDGFHQVARAVDSLPNLPSHPRSAVHQALVDISARSLGVPAYRLLGGSGTSWRLSFSISDPSPDQVASAAQAKWNEGYRIFKLKVGAAPMDDPDRLAALAEAVPEAAIRLDYNGSATERGLRVLAPSLSLYGVDLVEEPFRVGQWSRLAEMRRWLDCSISLDESIATVEDVRHAGAEALCDVVTLKLGRLGSVAAVMEAGCVAERYGLSLYAGAMNESYLGMAASASVYSTIGGWIDGCDFYYPGSVMTDPGLLCGRHAVDDGAFILSDDPGFGIECPEEWFTNE